MNQKCNPGLVTFKRTDEKPAYLERVAREFASHFQTKRVSTGFLFYELKGILSIRVDK